MSPLHAIIALIVSGFLLMASEVFVPGMILGMIGGICLSVAVWISFVAYGVYVGMLTLVSVGVCCLIGFVIWIFFFPKTYLGRKITNRNALDSYSHEAKASVLLGKKGVALTMLRPSGTALIDGVRVDVTAENQFIERGVGVEVIGVEGPRVTVRKAS